MLEKQKDCNNQASRQLISSMKILQWNNTSLTLLIVLSLSPLILRPADFGELLVEKPFRKPDV